MKKVSLLSAGTALVLLASALACNATAGIPIAITLSLEGSGTTSVTSASGWTITLTEARLVVGPLYVYAPLPDTMARLERALLPVAHAHGGFEAFEGREVRAQLLEQRLVDALGAPHAIELDAFEGEVEALTALLDPPEEASQSALHSHFFWVAGTASRDGLSLQIEGGLDLPEGGLERRVDAIPVHDRLVDGSTLHVAVDPSRWLSEADFTGLTPDADGVVRIAAGAQPARAWLIAARSPTSFVTRVTSKEN